MPSMQIRPGRRRDEQWLGGRPLIGSRRRYRSEPAILLSLASDLQVADRAANHCLVADQPPVRVPRRLPLPDWKVQVAVPAMEEPFTVPTWWKSAEPRS